MTDLPHNRFAAVFFNIIEQGLRTFHLGYEGSAGLLLQDGAGKYHHQLIAPYDFSLLINDSYAVCIAVKGNDQIGLMFMHRIYSETHIFQHCRVRVMVRETTVRFAEEFDYLAAHR